MKLVSIFIGILVTYSANALTVNVSFPEGVPEGKVTTSFDFTIEQAPGKYNHVSSSVTYKSVQLGLSAFIKELAGYQPVADSKGHASILTIALEKKSNTCIVRQAHTLPVINLQLFKDGHCLLG